MAYLKYYADENLRHRVAESIKLSFKACEDLTKWLCRYFNLEPGKVSLVDRKNKRFSRIKKVSSWYSAGTNEIVYHPSMLTPLTVAHEVAHYAHTMDRRRRYKEARAAADAAGKYFRFRKERWHGPEHRQFVERGVAALKTLPSLQKYFAETPEGEMAREELRLQQVLRDGLDPIAKPRNDGALVQAFYETLPENLTCPCCKFHGHKMNFGVRVIKRDANGVPVKMRPQSYCKACR